MNTAERAQVPELSSENQNEMHNTKSEFLLLQEEHHAVPSNYTLLPVK